MDTLQKQYQQTLRKTLQKDLALDNIMAVPHVEKIVVNMGVKDAVSDKRLIEKMSAVLGQITGQKAKVTRAKKSIASFKLREGDPVGLVVTMRNDRMYQFLDKLIKLVLPRIKDFRGVKRSGFDAHGNYTLGLIEYSVFPEIDLGTVDRLQGMEISIVTSATNKEHGMKLLEALGMPFEKEQIHTDRRV
jgi:large subunit ribosomal protein L5